MHSSAGTPLQPAASSVDSMQTAPPPGSFPDSPGWMMSRPGHVHRTQPSLLRQHGPLCCQRLLPGPFPSLNQEPREDRDQVRLHYHCLTQCLARHGRPSNVIGQDFPLSWLPQTTLWLLTTICPQQVPPLGCVPWMRQQPSQPAQQAVSPDSEPPLSKGVWFLSPSSPFGQKKTRGQLSQRHLT